MKTTLDLPDDLVRQLKLRAVLQGRTLKELTTELLRQALSAPAPVERAQEPDEERLLVTSDGLPVFRCRPDAPATKMSVEELLALAEQASEEEDRKRARLPL